MSDLFWLTGAQMARRRPFFPKSHGKPRVNDRRVLSGIIFINRNGLRWPAVKTLVANRGDDLLRNALKDRDITAYIPSFKARKTPIPHDAALSRPGHRIEDAFARLKDWRRVATRYDRCPKIFPSACAHTFIFWR